ncbi:hypothetical protein OSB04_031502 [Centaurea solstitialis]|uniref:Uncharacterized protein n=1 Tax=Centaurea solstitialis TaxID=347529 RepID=A0AA38S938_9ASTR|nr:hypothetical protein OSB04_031502 [Centaurea solstitialis]
MNHGGVAALADRQQALADGFDASIMDGLSQQLAYQLSASLPNTTLGHSGITLTNDYHKHTQARLSGSIGQPTNPPLSRTSLRWTQSPTTVFDWAGGLASPVYDCTSPMTRDVAEGETGNGPQKLREPKTISISFPSLRTLKISERPKTKQIRRTLNLRKI